MPETSFLCCWELIKAHLHIPYLKEAGEKNGHKDMELGKTGVMLVVELSEKQRNLFFC